MKKYNVFILVGLIILTFVTTTIVCVYLNLGRGGYNPGYSYINNTVEVKGLNITITGVQFDVDSTILNITFENTTRKEKDIYIYLERDWNGNSINEEIDVDNILIDGVSSKVIKPKTTSYATVTIPYYLKSDENSNNESVIDICSQYFYIIEEE
jgi:hypothetical protein